MKVAVGAGAALLVVLSAGPDLGSKPRTPPRTTSVAIGAALSSHPSPASVDPKALTAVVQRYCVTCHNNQLLTAQLSLQEFDVVRAAELAETAERMITKLRLGMMPPPGMPRPAGDTLAALVETLETSIDRVAARRPDPGRRGFQRLNRAEYANSVHDLLDLEIDPAAYLPPDTKSENFDNIADVQMPSATVMDAYLTAASEISRIAVGDRNATAKQATYSVPRLASQTVHVEGTPRGTRGGLSVLHTFPADGSYDFTATFYLTLTGNFFGAFMRDEQLEVSIDGERVALIDVDRFMLEADSGGVTRRTPPVLVKAGQHRVSAAFLKTFDGPAQDVIAPIRQGIADLQAGNNMGMTLLPHLFKFAIRGPHEVAGLSETPSRRRIFSCVPGSAAEERTCAREIIARLGQQAYRQPLGERDLVDLMGLYEERKAEAGFEAGIQTALQAILSSPAFLFRFEEEADVGRTGQFRPVSDIDLASRLSYFLWGAPPDQELLQVAQKGELSRPDVLERQVRRMLRDGRSEALASRFAGQWLRLQDLTKVSPDVDTWPNFDLALRDAMLRETELFFSHIVREDRSVLDLLDADYTFVNETLARHYGIPNVGGERFRMIQLADGHRRGLLGQGSVLVQTSHANRTSPVLRGKWVMEVLLNSPPPPPPPNVPGLEETTGAKDGRQLTVRERMEMHRSAALCQSCHQYIDPLGLALENFDVTAQWRIKDAGNPVDPVGKLWDGSVVAGPEDLRQALLKYRTPFLRAFTKNLFAFGTGRRVEYYDWPTIRAITRDAEASDNRLSAFILGVVKSDAFRMRRPAEVTNSSES
jgi:hypothetical protein